MENGRGINSRYLMQTWSIFRTNQKYLVLIGGLSYVANRFEEKLEDDEHILYIGK